MSKDMMHGRLAEWITSSVMVAFAIILALPGDTLLDNQSYSFFIRLGFSETALAVPMVVIGMMRMMALYINGNWRRTPVIRAFGACVGAAGFAFLAASLTWPYFFGTQPALSTGAGTYAVLAFFDILAAYRSGHDARIART